MNTSGPGSVEHLRSAQSVAVRETAALPTTLEAVAEQQVSSKYTVIGGGGMGLAFHMLCGETEMLVL